MSELRLNLGCSDRIVPGFVGVDIAPPADQIVDMSSPWPWETSSVSEVLAYSVFEHIGDCDHQVTLCSRCYPIRRGGASGCMVCGMMPCYVTDTMETGRLSPGCASRFRDHLAKIHTMNELWRVLKPGGIARLQLPHATEGDGGHCDPTHKSYWTTTDFEYYEPGFAERERFRQSYPVKADFKILNLDSNGHIPKKHYARRRGGFVVEFDVVLEAVKNAA